LTVSEQRARGWSAPPHQKWIVRVVTPDGDRPAPASLAGLDDHGLVQACRAGERLGFDLLVARHQRAVYQICYRFARNHADASDLVQEAFLRAWRGLAGFNGRSSVRTWLYRIAVNACLNRTSRRAAPEPIEERRLAADEGDGPSDRMLRLERATLVRRAIARLPDTQRATVILRVYHDLPHAEIAAILGSSVGSVKANFFHALRNLRRLLGSEP
jgi:RNA polymerase sigma-70 factor, ECF subfamily